MPSTSDEGAYQYNPILIEHPVEGPLIVTPLASLPPTSLILFDGLGAIKASSEDSVASDKEKGSSIFDESVLSPSLEIPPTFGSSPSYLSTSSISLTKTGVEAVDNDIPLQ